MKTAPPVLPVASNEYDRRWQDSFNRILALFFNRLTSVGPLEATTLRVVALTPSSTIQHPVDPTTTTFTLADATLFPDTGFGTIALEKFQWTGKSGNSLIGILRGQLGTTATHHGHNTLVIAAVEQGVVYSDQNNFLKVLP
jgi:hypothetical protein